MDKAILLFLNRDVGGRREESRARNRNLPFNPASVDAVNLLHVHIEHSGNLPNLVMNEFEGPIYATKATAHVAQYFAPVGDGQVFLPVDGRTVGANMRKPRMAKPAAPSGGGRPR